jgi:DNA modification methylase
MSNHLAKLEKAAALLAECNTIESVTQIRDTASAAAHYCKAQRLSADAYNRAAEIKLRAERKAGELLAAAELAKGHRFTGASQSEAPAEITLDSLGVSHKESHKWQAIAAVPAEQFENHVAECKEQQKEIRTGEFVKIGQQIKRAAKCKLSEVNDVANEPNSEWRLINAEVLDGLEQIRLSGERARLIFTDPPYNIGVDYGDGQDADLRSDDDYLGWVVEWLDICREILTDDGSLWVMIGDEYAAEYATILKGMGLTIRSWIKWYETFGVNCSNKFNRTSRHIFYAVKDPKRFVFHREAVSRPSDRQTIYNDPRANPDGKIWDDVWEIPRLVGNATERLSGFPTQLPLDLVNPIVLCASDPGDLVIDPFNGSGTTGVSAIQSGRKYIGIELSEEFYSRASIRLSNSQLPLREIAR